MKKELVLLILLSLNSMVAMSQEADSSGVVLDLLRAPVSPASGLLGIATTDIDKPTDVSSLMLSIQSANSALSKFPSNYAMDIAPFLLAKNRGYTTDALKSEKFKDVFRQTFVLSAAIINPDSTATDKSLSSKSTYAGFGFKFSILRGKYDEKTDKELSKIKKIQQEMVNSMILKAKAYNMVKLSDPEYIALDQMRKTMLGKDPSKFDEIMASDEYKAIETELAEKLEKYFAENKEKIKESEAEEIKKIAAKFQTSRIGFSWDVSGGISAEFINRQFDWSKVNNAGVWTNFGYTAKCGTAFLGLIRYLYNPDKIFALDDSKNSLGDISTLDLGLRIAQSKPQSKLSFSVEAIYRSVLSSNTISPSWKTVFNADYTILKNQKLTFSFGRNFDGTVSKDGNLIAALTLIQGFGNRR